MKFTLKEKGVLLGFPFGLCVCLIFLANLKNVYLVEAKLTLSESPISQIQRGALKGVNRGVRKLIRLSHRSQRTSSLQSFHEKISIVESAQFANDFIREYKLKPMMFPKRWDHVTQTWKKRERGPIGRMLSIFRGDSGAKRSPNAGDAASNEPRDWVAIKYFSEVFSITQEKNSGIITMRLRWKDPKAGAEILNALVEYANIYISKRQQKQIEDNIRAMEIRLEQEVMPELKTFLFEHIESMKSTLVTHNVQIAPTFSVIDKAYAPQEPIFRVPKVLMIVGFVFGLLCAFVFLVIQRVRNDESKPKECREVSATS